MVAIIGGSGFGLKNSSAAVLGQAGLFGKAQLGATGQTSYVNVATGALIIQQRDDFLASAGQDISLVRTYNSNGNFALTAPSQNNSDYWTVGPKSRLILSGTVNTAGSSIRRVDADGSTTVLTYTASGEYRSTDGGGAYQTVKFSNNEYVWRTGEAADLGAVQVYNAAGQLLRSGDMLGQYNVYSYNADGTLERVTDASGEYTRFTYDASKNLTSIIEKLTSNTSEVTRVAYGYDTLGRLTAVVTALHRNTTTTNPDPVMYLRSADGSTTPWPWESHYGTWYAYDGDSRRVTNVTQSDGTSINYAYDPATGKVSSVIDAYGYQTTFTYGAGSTTVTDPYGAKTVYTYNTAQGASFGQLTSVTGPAVNDVSQRTSYNYDANGNVLSVVSRTVSYQKDASGNVTTVVSADSNEIAYEYDANGNRILERDPTGKTITRRYDLATNLLTSQTTYLTRDPDGAGSQGAGGPQTEYFAYDANNNLRFHISAEGRIKEYRYAANTKSLIAAITYTGNRYSLAGFTPDTKLSATSVAGWVATNADRSKSLRTDYAIDARGLLKSATTYSTVDAAGNGVRTAGTFSVEQYTYDQAGALIQRIDGNNNASSFGVDAFDRLKWWRDPMSGLIMHLDTPSWSESIYEIGAAYDGTYRDANGLVRYTISADQSIGTQTETYYQTDRAGRVIIETVNGRQTRYFYDAAGRKIAGIDPTGAVTEYTYDKDGRPSATIRYATRLNQLIDWTAMMAQNVIYDFEKLRPAGNNGANRIDRNYYNASGELIQTVDGDGFLTEFTYDGLGRLTQEKRYAIAVTTSLTGKSVTPPSSSPDDRTVNSYYDKDGKLIGRIDGDGYATRMKYDDGGQLVETRRYFTPVGAAARAGAFAPTEHPNDIRERMFYNAKGQLVGKLDGAGYLTEYSYDGAGNLSTVTRRDDPADDFDSVLMSGLGVTANPSKDQTTIYRYTAFNKVSEEIGPDGNWSSYQYDIYGNLSIVQRAWGAADERIDIKNFDRFGNLRSSLSGIGAAEYKANPANANAIWSKYGVNYALDLYGRTTAITAPNGRTTRLFYDDAGRQVLSINAAGEIQETRYNAFGQVEQQILRSKRLTAEQLSALANAPTDTAGALALSAASGTDEDTIQNFGYDRRGNLADQYYGLPGRPVDAVNGTGYHKLYRYNAFGELDLERTQKTSGTGYIDTSYTYDRRGNLETTRPFNDAALASTTRYDAFGNAYMHTDARGVTTTTTYDKLNRAIVFRDGVAGANGKGVTTAYDAFSRVLSQTDQLGRTTTYTHDTRARTVTMTTPEGVTQTTTRNVHGEVVSIKDHAGQVTTFSYDASGQLKSVTDSQGTRESHDYDAGGLKTSSTDANGKVTSFTYDAAGRLFTSTLDPVTDANPGALNLVTTYAYDAKGQVATVTDPAGVVTKTTYDRKGQVKSIAVDPSGLNLVTNFDYDSRGNRIQVKAPDGTVTTYNYSETSYGSESVIDPNGLAIKTVVKYDRSGKNIVLKSDGSGLSTRYAYNANNQLTWEMSAEGIVTSYTYDDAGQLIGTTRYAQPSKLLTATTPWDTVFDESEIKQSVTADPANDATTRTIRDHDGRVYATINPTGTLTVNLALDGYGRVTDQVTYAKALDATQLASIDTLEEVKNLVTSGALANPALDTRTKAFYDVRGNMTRTLTALGVDGATGQQSWLVTKLSYDKNGNLSERIRFAAAYNANAPTLTAVDQWITSAAGATNKNAHERMFYDAANRLTETAVSQGINSAGTQLWAITIQDYDKAGRVIGRRTAAQPLPGSTPTTENIRQAFRNSVSTNDAHVRYVYDAAGRVTHSATAMSADSTNTFVDWSVTSNSYDSAGNLVTSTRLARPLSSSTLPSPATADAYTQWIRNAVAATANTVTDQVSRFAYDKAGRLLISIDPAGSVTRNVYDSAGRLVSRVAYATPATGNAPIDRSYAPARQDGADRYSWFGYDRDGNLLIEVSPGGAVSERTYDSAGRVTTLRRHATEVTIAAGAAPQTLTQLRGLLKPGPQDRVEQSIYDAAGRELSRLDAAGYLTRYEYDALGQVKTTLEYELKPDVTLVNGKLNITAKGTAEQIHTTRFDYDAAGRLAKLTDARDEDERYGYDALGNRTSLINKLDREWTYQYDAAGRVVLETGPTVQVSNVSWSQAAETGKYSMTVTTVDAKPVTSFTYDALGRLSTRTEQAGAAARTTKYRYDAAGHQISIEHPQVSVYNGSTDWYGNPTGMMTPYSSVRYDIFGNAVEAVDAGGKRSYKAYDKEGRIRYEVDALGYVTEHQYDAFGGEQRLIRYDAKPNLAGVDATSVAALEAALKNLAHDKDRIIVTQFDKDGRQIRVTEPAAYTYDAGAGKVELLQKTTTFEYNRFGDVTMRKVFGATPQGVQVGKAQAQYSSYDAAGRLLMQADVVGYDGANPRVYLTAYTYDHAGNRESRTEYARAVVATEAALLAGSFPAAQASEDDRKVSWTYDALNQVRSEVRHNVEYDNNGMGATRGDIVTSYGYDAVGNQVSTTDALGNTSYTYYNALGHVAATATVHAVSHYGERAPLTVYRRDIHGNVVQRIDYALGAGAGTNDKDYVVAGTDTNDRVSGNAFDIHGRVILSVDAEQNGVKTAYDALGRVAAVWQRVTAADGATRTAFQVTHYDALGRVTSVDTPSMVEAGAGHAIAVTTKGTEYNAFGEVNSRYYRDNTTNGANRTYARFDYDNAGNAWRSNDGDGVERVLLHDVFGNNTASIHSVDAAGTQAVRSLTSTERALELSMVARTETRYDLLGNVVDQRQADTLQVLLFGADKVWRPTPLGSHAVPADSLIVVGGPGDEDARVEVDGVLVNAERHITVKYRRVGTMDWIDAAAPRVRQVDDFTVFSVTGLDTGSYEYSVTVQTPGEQPFVRSSGRVDVTSAASTERNLAIVKLYTALLGRMPDAAGLNYWVDFANKGATLLAITELMLESQEAKDFLRSDSEMAARIFTQSFGQDGFDNDSLMGDVLMWRDRLLAASPNPREHRAQVVLELIESVWSFIAWLPHPKMEAARNVLHARVNAAMNYVVNQGGNNKTTREELYALAKTEPARALAEATAKGKQELQQHQVAQLYVAMFARAPEAASMTYYMDKLAVGHSIETVAAGMLDSTEAKAATLYPQDNIPVDQYRRQLVVRTYQNALGREPSTSELSMWMSKLNGTPGTLAISAGEFMVQFIWETSTYEGTDPLRLADKALFNNKSAISLKFAVLGRNDNGDVSRALMAAVRPSDKPLTDTPLSAITAAYTVLKDRQADATNALTGTTLAAAAAPTPAMRARLSLMFAALLNRAPDALGMEFYLKTRPQTEADWTVVAASILSSEEARTDGTLAVNKLVNGQLVALSDAEFVERIYQLATGSLPSSSTGIAEMNAYKARLAAGTSRAALAASMIGGLFTTAGISNAERAARTKFENKAAVGETYAIDLGASDPKVGRDMLALVTATDISAAITYGYGKVQALIAAAALVSASQSNAALADVRAERDAVTGLINADLADRNAEAAAAAVSTGLFRLQLMRLYVGLLGRSVDSFRISPDVAGLEFHVDVMSKGTTLAQVADAVLKDAEGVKAMPPTLTDREFVQRLLGNLVGSAVPAADVTYWTGKIPGSSRGAVAVDIIASVLDLEKSQPVGRSQAYIDAREDFERRVADAYDYVEASARQLVSETQTAIAQQQSIIDSISPTLPTLEQDKNNALAAAANEQAAARNALTNANASGDGSAVRRLQVTRLLATLLGRSSPSLSEVDGYVTSPDTLEVIAEKMIVSAGTAVFSTHPATFINQLYQRMLGRLPTDTFYLDQLNATAGQPNARGRIAAAILVDYFDRFSDSTSAQLQLKKSVDERLHNNLASQRITADGNTSTALSARNDRYKELTDANAWVDNRYKRLQEVASEAGTAQRELWAANTVRNSGDRQSITYINLILGRSTSLTSMYSDVTAGRTYTSQLNNWVAARSWQSDVDFIRSCYSQVFPPDPNRPTQADIDWWMQSMGSESGRRTVADNIFSSAEAKGIYANSLNSALASQDFEYSIRESNYNQATANYKSVEREYLDASNAASAASRAYDAADTAYQAAAKISATYAALVTAHLKVVSTDGFSYDKALIAEKYTTAKEKFDLATKQKAALQEKLPGLNNAVTAHAAAHKAADASAIAAAALETLSRVTADGDVPLPVEQTRKIAELHVVLLNRAPTLTELQYWMGHLKHLSTLRDVALAMMRSEEALRRSLYPANMTPEAFVTQLYQFGLGRDFSADPAGLQFWASQLQGATQDRYAQLALDWIDSFSGSTRTDAVTFDNNILVALQKLLDQANAVGPAPDLSANIAAADKAAIDAAKRYDEAAAAAADTPLGRAALMVTRLYAGIFGRIPDSAGLQFWIRSAMTPGVVAATIAQNMLDSDEAKAIFPANQDATSFVLQLLTSLYGRTPTDAERAGAMSTLSSAGRGGLAAWLIQKLTERSTGNAFDNAWTTLFNNKVQQALSIAIAELKAFVPVVDAAVSAADQIKGTNLVDTHPSAIVKGISTTPVSGKQQSKTPDEYTVDRWGNILSVRDERDPNWITSYRYDANNRLVMVMHPKLPGKATATTESSRYDQLGRMTASVDARGYTSRVKYDANGFVREEIYADGNKATYGVDVFGNRKTVTQGNGVTTTYQYDRLGQQVRRESAQTTIYHAVGSDTGEFYPIGETGHLVETYRYDELGHRIASSNGFVSTLRGAVMSPEAHTYYDFDGNVIGTKTTGGDRTRNYYDSFGREIKRVDGNGKAMTWTYDTAGRLKSHVDLGGRTYAYEYNGGGQLTSVKDVSGTGKNIEYGYDVKGQLVKIDDKATFKLTTYRYDSAGNRIVERIVDSATGMAFQNQSMKFDRLGRMTDIRSFTEGTHEIHYEYDANGNRLEQHTRYTDVKGVHEIRVVNTFDKMNRQESVQSTERIAGGEWKVLENTTLKYDGAGNRSEETSNGVLQRYQYDTLGRLENITDASGVVLASRKYDGASRIVESIDAEERRLNVYDESGRLAHQRIYDQYNSFQYEVVYADANWLSGYDGAGNLKSYFTLQGNIQTIHTFKYDGSSFDSYQQSEEKVERYISGKLDKSAISLRHYDKNGNLSHVENAGQTTKTFVTDNEGRIIKRSGEGDAEVHSLIVNGMAIGGHTEGGDHTFGGAIEEMSSPALTAAPGVYVAQRGDTLQSIAQSVWGDATLWYLIAEANGGIANDAPTENMVLTLPSRANTVRNDYQTFRPYDAAAVIGDTSPVLPPLVVETASSSGNKCGFFGQLIAVVIAVVVTAYLGPAGATGAKAILGWAGAAAAGSVASQAFSIAVGIQDKFNWKAVALAAVSAGVTQGVTKIPGLDGNAWYHAAARAAVSNIASQGIGIVTGLQETGFSWRAVAASAAGGVVGHLTKPGSTNNQFERIAKATASGFAAGATTAVLRGGKISVVQIATDAFGNALGNSLAASARSSSSAATFEQDMDKRAAANPLLAAMSKQNRRDLANQILAEQAATEPLGGGQENGYASVPYSPGDLPRNSFPGATLGAFLGGSRSDIDLGYDPSKPHVIITAPRLSAEQWAAIDRYEAGRTAAAFGAGIVDGITSIPRGVWETAKTVGEGYRGLVLLATGNIDRYQPRSRVTLDSIARGFVNSTPVGVLGTLASGDYRGAGANTIGTIAGIAGARLGPSISKLPVLNYNVPALPGFAPSGTGFKGTRYQVGAVGDLSTTQTLSLGGGHAIYTIDEVSGLTMRAEGTVTGPHPGRGKGKLPEPIGGRLSGEHRGHLIPEGGVDYPHLVNIPQNLISEAPGSNLGLKKIYDLKASRIAAENPNSTVRFISEPIRKVGDVRPFAVSHYITIDGRTVEAVSIFNR